MAGKRERKAGKRPGALTAVLAAVLVLLGSGEPHSAAVSSPLEAAFDQAAEGARMKAERLLWEEAPEASGQAEVDLAQAPGPVPESEAVDDTYFDGAVFLGDSRTEGFYLYSGLQTGQYLYAVGATVESVFSKAVWGEGSGKVPLLDALAALECDKIYLMLGVNELGWSKIENFRDQYAKVIDRIQEDHPEAEIALQSILPVSARQEAKKTYVNNQRITEYNEVIAALAAEKGCAFVNVAEALVGEDGCLPANLNFDGVHLNPAGCAIWLNYLRTHRL